MHTMSNCLHPYGPQQARLLCPWDSRQEYLTGLLCPSPGDLPNPGIGPTSLTSTCIGRWVLYHEHHLGSPWDIWFSLINNNLLMFRLPKTFEKFLLQKFRTFGVFCKTLFQNLCITWLLPSPPWSSSLRVTWDTMVTWDAISWACNGSPQLCPALCNPMDDTVYGIL